MEYINNDTNEQTPDTKPSDGELSVNHNEEPVDAPRIYVASLADYNAGRLHGRWLDAAQEPEELEQQIQQMLSESEEEVAEEWAIHDYDNFGRLHLGEYESMETVSTLAKGITEHGQAFAAWAALAGAKEATNNPAEFNDAYLGEYESVEAFAEEELEDYGLTEILDRAVPGSLRYYVDIDIEAFARDLKLSGDIHTAPADDGGVWVFRSL
jgi:antirestriction protein